MTKPHKQPQKKLVIVSGRSGSGKSAALNVLEDSGYTCIDNLPARFLLDLFSINEDQHDQKAFAVGIDVRNLWRELREIPDMVSGLRKNGVDCKIVFLDASTETLIKRFSETRRKHPLSGEGVTLGEALAKETALLKEIEQVAGLTLNTDELSPYELNERLRTSLGLDAEQSTLLLFQSFGFKYGVPSNADYVFDVRCLPNPHWIPELRKHTGLEDPVKEYLSSEPDVIDMANSINSFLERWLPELFAGTKSYITVAIGCTGGKHRSVYLAEQLCKNFSGTYANVQARHREIGND